MPLMMMYCSPALIFPVVVPLIFPGVLIIPFWLWMLVDCIQRPIQPLSRHVKWIAVNALTFGIGGFVYFVSERPRYLPAPKRATGMEDEAEDSKDRDA